MYKSRWVEKLMGFDHNFVPPSESVLIFDFALNLFHEVDLSDLLL